MRSSVLTKATGWHAVGPKPAIVPFDAEQAKKYQIDWAAYLQAPVDYTNSIGIKFRMIPRGECKVGSSQSQIHKYVAEATNAGLPEFRIEALKEEGPQRLATIDQAFYFGVHEVTQKAWFSVMRTNPSTHEASEHRPVEGISWLDAVVFCNRLSEQEGRSPAYRIDGEKVDFVEAYGYRLPIIDEWEYACRAGTLTPYFFGDAPNPLEDYAWFLDNSSSQTHSVGRKLANPLGPHDIYGIVCELSQRSKTATMVDWQPQRGMA